MKKTFIKNKYFLAVLFLLFIVCSSVLIIQNNFKAEVSVSADTSSNRTFTDARNNYSDSQIASIDYYCIKDDNIVFTANQNPFGTCWTFAGLKSVETALSLATNEVYDFSEAWIALIKAYDDSSYIIGRGGTGGQFGSLIEKYGLVLESDMPYEVLANIDSAQREDIINLYNYYSQFADKDILKALIKSYSIHPNIIFNATSDSFIKNIKRQVINNGACEISVNADCTATNSQNDITTYYTSSYIDPNHAVTVVGWDDNITIAGNESVKGAFIVLNSWGNYSNEGYIYVMYQNKSIAESLGYSVDTSKLTSYNKLESSSSDLKNWYSHIAESNNSSVVEKSLNQGNVFYLGEDLNITYSFLNSGVDYSKVNLSIFDGDDLTNDLQVTRQNNKITLTKNNLDNEACYKLQFHYDLDDDGIIDSEEEVYYKQIFVSSGVIIDRVTGNIPQGFQSQSVNFSDIWVVNDSQVTMSIGSYSYIAKLEKVDKSSSSFISRLGISVSSIADSTSYSTGECTIYFNTSKITEKNKWFTEQIKFTTTKDQTKIINVHFMKVDNIYVDLVHINYLTNYKNLQSIPKVFAKTSTIALYPLNDKTGYYFDGWSKDSDFSYMLEDNKMQAEDYVTINSKTAYFQNGKNFNYAILYPKFSLIELVVKDVSLSSGKYNEYYSNSLNCVVSGKGDYSYEIVSGNLPQGLSFDNGTIYGTPYEIGNYTLTIRVTDNVLNMQKDCQVTFTINKMQLVYVIQSQSSAINEPILDMNLTLVEGSVRDEDGKVVDIDKSRVINTVVGDYPVSLINNKPQFYDVSLRNPSDAVYSITKIQVKLSVNNYVGDYDGQSHNVSASVENLQEGQYVIEYSLDNISYSKNLSLTNATNGEVVVYVKAISLVAGYDDNIKQAIVKINKLPLNVTLLQREYEYNFDKQSPQIRIDGAINNETISYQINVDGEAKSVGVYNATVTLNSNSTINYYIANPTVEFEITKISPTYEIVKMDENELSICRKVADLELPIVQEGFIVSFVNPEQELVEGDNIIEIKITPSSSLQDIYKTTFYTYHIEKPSLTLEVSPVFYIVLCAIVVIIMLVVATIIIVKINKKKENVSISFVSNSTLPVTSIKGKKNKKQVLPIPFKPGSEFEGWYEDKELTKPYVDNGDKETKTLYAKWKLVTREDIIRPNIDKFKTYKNK